MNEVSSGYRVLLPGHHPDSLKRIIKLKTQAKHKHDSAPAYMQTHSHMLIPTVYSYIVCVNYKIIKILLKIQLFMDFDFIYCYLIFHAIIIKCLF